MNKFTTWFNTKSGGMKAAIIAGTLIGTASIAGALSGPPPEVEAPEDNKPVITTEVVKETEVIPYDSEEKEDDSLAKGKTKVSVEGENGERTISHKVTYEDGDEVSREETSSKVTKKPVTEVTLIGTYVKPEPVSIPEPPKASNCDPNYSGCVPIASDVDCGGGSGNGPAYQYGAVNVIGTDIYDLDRDGDGVGCE